MQPEEALRDQLERRGTLCVRSTQQGGRHCGVFQHYHRPLRINNLAWHTVATKCYELFSTIRDWFFHAGHNNTTHWIGGFEIEFDFWPTYFFIYFIGFLLSTLFPPSDRCRPPVTTIARYLAWLRSPEPFHARSTLFSLYFPHRDVIKNIKIFPSSAQLTLDFLHFFYDALWLHLSTATPTEWGGAPFSGGYKSALERKCAPSGVAKLHACYYSAFNARPHTTLRVDELMVSSSRHTLASLFLVFFSVNLVGWLPPAVVVLEVLERHPLQHSSYYFDYFSVHYLLLHRARRRRRRCFDTDDFTSGITVRAVGYKWKNMFFFSWLLSLWLEGLCYRK